VERKEEAGHARQHSGRQKDLGPPVESFAASSPNRTTNPEKIPTKLITTYTKVYVSNIMMRLPKNWSDDGRVQFPLPRSICKRASCAFVLEARFF
jgi:hypothetical protein